VSLASIEGGREEEGGVGAALQRSGRRQAQEVEDLKGREGGREGGKEV
jgi:hypothetical protein